MKNLKFKIVNILLAVVILLSFSACDFIGVKDANKVNNINGTTDLTETGYNLDEEVQKVSVTFVYNNGDTDSTVLVEEGKTVSTPESPLKPNYLFMGWYSDVNLTEKYDFSKAVTKALTLYAGFSLDAVTLTNKISTDVMKSVVKIYNKNYNTNFFGTETGATSQGSGFCFLVEDGCYYILTNCHVALKDSTYSHQKYTIEDYQGKTYEGHLYKNPNKTFSAIAAAYDLACLYFTASESETNVKPLPIVAENPSPSDDVVSLGAPKGQSNFITYGKVIDYRQITLSETNESLSDVEFDVIYHNAFINNGSSGGPLLNSDLEVIGVNYAGNSTSEQSFSDQCFAVPAEKINEFLSEYFYS